MSFDDDSTTEAHERRIAELEREILLLCAPDFSGGREMSLHVDQRDTPSTTGDKVLDGAWNERKALRLQHFDIAKKIEALDIFIAEYQRRTSPEPEIGCCSCTPAQSGPGWGSSGSVNPLCPLHGQLCRLHNSAPNQEARHE